MYKRKIEMTIYVPDGRYCNIGPKERCRFCCKHANGYTCALNQELLQMDGKYIRKAEECTWPSPYPVKYYEPELKIDAQELINEAGEKFIRIYKTLRRAGTPEDMALSLARKKMKEV